MADIDHFKKVNDTYGHQVGDAVLQQFASIVTQNIKGQDMVARYGGEEFAIILPETDLFSAYNLLVKIKYNFKKHGNADRGHAEDDQGRDGLLRPGQVRTGHDPARHDRTGRPFPLRSQEYRP
jgi:GGDEF domain-containing protein